MRWKAMPLPTRARPAAASSSTGSCSTIAAEGPSVYPPVRALKPRELLRRVTADGGQGVPDECYKLLSSHLPHFAASTVLVQLVDLAPPGKAEG